MTKVNNILIFIFIILIASSCREESDEFINIDEAQNFTASSKTANLILKTTMNDGSNDNIIDSTSCFNLRVPLTVLIDGEEVTISSANDYERIEEIIEESNDDPDEIDFIFPITAIFNDFSETILENKNQFDELVKKCNEENKDEDDDDDDDDNDDDDDEENIECIDFKYPLSISVFDRQNEFEETIAFTKDKELFRFVKNLKNNDIASIRFPITMVYSNDNEIIVDDLNALEIIIEESLDECE